VTFKLVIVLAREDVEVHLHALQIMTEEFQLCEWGLYRRLGKLYCCSEITSGSWDAPDYPTCPRTPFAVIRPLRVIMEPTEYCTTILLPKPSQNLPLCFAFGSEPGIPDCRLPWVFSKRKLFLM
jgi:hypothetical protein